MASVTLSVNGESHTLDVDPAMPLLYALRDDLGLNNPRFGCGLSQCGACTVMINGLPVRSCIMPVSAVSGEVTTLNGLGTEAEPHPVQQAFIDEQVPFCGFCTNGWVMYSVAMLENNPNVTDAEMRQQFAGLKCRCGSHTAILRAVKKAAETMQG